MTTKTELLQVIRKRCLECCSGSYQDVENCTTDPDKCSLWSFRLGKDPEEPTEGKKLAGKRLCELRKARKAKIECITFGFH